MSCADEGLLAEIAAGMRKRGDHPSQLLASHLDKALASRRKPMRLFRALDAAPFKAGVGLTYRTLNALPEAPALASTNCHNGQKKLTLTLLEFLAVALTKVDAADALVVYPGASGLATVIAAQLFPALKFVAYDPAPNTLQLMPPFEDKAVYRDVPDRPDGSKRLLVFTDRAGWFDDASCDYVRRVLLPATGRSRVLFVSDIRAEREEGAIARDMLNQARWAVRLAPDSYMFKFRLPYQNAAAACVAFGRELGAFLSPKGAPGRGPHLPYVAGKLYVQPYARPTTAELRLVGHGPVRATFYSVARIENAMALFNAVYRGHARFGRRAVPYEEAVEDAVLEACARRGGADREDMRALMEGYITSFIRGKGEDECAGNAVQRELQKRPNDPLVRRVAAACGPQKRPKGSGRPTRG